MEPRQPELKSYVIKLQHPNLSDRNDCFEVTKELKDSYGEITQLFGGDPSLIPREYFAIISGLDGQPTGASFQEYYGRNIRDVFTDITGQELIRLITNNQSLRKQFEHFIKVVDNNPDVIEKEIDIIGYRNLVIATDKDGNPVLKFLDAHYRRQVDHGDHLSHFIPERIEYIKSILESANGNRQPILQAQSES